MAKPVNTESPEGDEAQEAPAEDTANLATTIVFTATAEVIPGGAS